jgi:hypothetical protein
MKSTQAWFACSLVSVTCALASCGDDDGKRVVRAGDAGAGGESGGEPSNAGGSSVSPEAGAGGEPQPVPEGGAGGAPAVSAGGMSGEGGEAGQAPELLCFDVEAAGGAGGAGGAAPAPFEFACADITGHYDPVAKKVVLDLLPGMEPTTTGRFSARYSYFEDPNSSACAEGSLTNTGTALELDFDFTPPVYEAADFHIPFVALGDECGGEVAMDHSIAAQGSCRSIHFVPPEQAGGEWSIDCYEGFGADCQETCPIIDL